MAISSIDFAHLILADLTAPFLPLFSFMTIPIFHLLRFFWSPWINTTSPFESWFFLPFDPRLWCSRSAFKYCAVHHCHARFLHFWIYLALSFKSLSSMLLTSSSNSEITIPESQYHLPRKTMVCYSVWFQCPYRAMNSFSARINSLVVWFWRACIWTALVKLHEKSNRYALEPLDILVR